MRPELYETLGNQALLPPADCLPSFNEPGMTK